MPLKLRTIFKYGLPISFVYCTIYQQNVWREGDEELVKEQKRVWKDFFRMIDAGYNSTLEKLGLQPTYPQLVKPDLITKLEQLEPKSCWNSKVTSAFKSIDQFIEHPGYIFCKAYRLKLKYFPEEKPKVPEGHGSIETPQ